MKQEEKTKLCPFKKIIEKSYSDHTGITTINERFAPCAGERCMAYTKRIGSVLHSTCAKITGGGKNE